MKLKQKERPMMPLLRNSILYLEEYCSREIFSQSGLLYRHKFKLYQNASNRRRFSRKDCGLSEIYTHKLVISQKSPNSKKSGMKDNCQTQKKSGILSIIPAVIHTSANPQQKLILTPASKTSLRQVEKYKFCRSKTTSNEWISQGDSFPAKKTNFHFFSTSRPKTANSNMSISAKIKVELPNRPWSSKVKDEAINGWENSQQEELK